jgi:hypothetical protein
MIPTLPVAGRALDRRWQAYVDERIYSLPRFQAKGEPGACTEPGEPHPPFPPPTLRR